MDKKIKAIFETSTMPQVMGILNITPDSFFDGGNYTNEKDWLKQCERMLTDGADIIDIGAYSTRPNAQNIAEQEEAKRLIVAIESVSKHFPTCVISVDTFRSSIAKSAVNAGATIINDISGGTLDESMYATIAELNVPYILMHIQGTPQTMQQQPTYNNVVKEVYQWLENSLTQLRNLGCQHLIADPGFGFGKTNEHNFELLQKLENFKQLNVPLLVGISRKSMITKILGITTKEALNGTSVLNTIALLKGAKILRVHDVKEAKEAIKLVSAL
jgi:dihydropteroate synthase